MKVKKSKINEADVTLDDKVKEAEKALDDPEVVSKKGQIEEILDRALETNLDNIAEADEGDHVDYMNVLLIGEAGTGKTSRVKAWAKANNVHLVTLLATGLDDTDLGGAITPSKDNTTVNRLATTELDVLDMPRSVLFLDELNRARKGIRGTLLTLIQDHVVTDPRNPERMRKLENFLFTIAAVNPWDENNAGADELEDAERSRFHNIYVYSDPNNTLQYFKSNYEKRVQKAEDAGNEKSKIKNMGRLNIATTLLSNRAFKFDDAQDIEQSKATGNQLLLTSRTLKLLLDACDGTKEDFLKQWNNVCNSLKKPMAERILANYQDVEDKANDVLKKDSDSEVFAKAKQKNTAKLRAAAAGL